MVVTRKTPLVPPPPASRTTSSQATPRVARSKAQALSNIQGVAVNDDLKPGSTYGSGNSNNEKGKSNDVDSSQNKHKSKIKSKKSIQNSETSRTTFGDILLYLFLAYFAIYTISICPTDYNHDSPICHGLSKYRELVMEPYLFPIYHRAIAHPSITPHIKRLKPHVDTAIRIGKPIVRRTRVEWNSRIVPQWKKRVLPQWNAHVAPQLHRVDQIFVPYRTRVMQQFSRYSNRIAPHVWTAKTKFQRWRRQVQPYVIFAATKTHDGYQAAKPYAKPLWNRIKAGTKQLLLFVHKQRVLFVDPHVARIWEKVKELSSGKPGANGTVRDEYATLTGTGATISVTEEDAVPPPTSSVVLSEARSFASVAASSTSTTTSLSIASETSTPVVTGSSTAPTGSITDSDGFAPASSLLESTSPKTVSPSVTSSFSDKVITPPDITDPSLTTNKPAPTPLEVADEADVDLDEFARELGLDDDAVTATEVDETIVPPPVETESEEEKAEKRRLKEIETAAKRAEIVSRHSKWEVDLQDLIKTKRKSLRKALVAIRKPAAVELKESKEVRTAMDELVADSEKYLKGAEAYLKTLNLERKESTSKIALWDKLISKVDAKFRQRLKDIDDLVNGWYTFILNREALEVQRVAADVKDLAGDAQADLGMDYSWLGDVTYQDWQRYHDLMRVSENFTQQATAIQKGTHPSPPINPVVDVLEELESEIDDIINGFETRLQKLKHNGESAFGGHVDDADTTGSTSKPEFSILPVPKDEADSEGATGDIPPVVIGRSKEEIEDAFSRAGEGAAAIIPRSVETESEIVGSLAEEVSVEAGRETAVLATGHPEL